MRQISILFTFLLLITASLAAQQPCKQYGPVGSVLAFCPPAGMAAVKKNPGEVHGGFAKASADGKEASVLVIIETTLAVSLGEFGYEMIKQAYADTEIDSILVSVGEIESANGVRGLRLAFVADAQQQGNTTKEKMGRIFYLYEGPKGAKLFFNAQFPASDTTVEAAIDNAMKTVKIKKL